MNPPSHFGIPLRMKTEAVGRAASPLAADGAHGVTRPTHFRGNREVVLTAFQVKWDGDRSDDIKSW